MHEERARGALQPFYAARACSVTLSPASAADAADPGVIMRVEADIPGKETEVPARQPRPAPRQPAPRLPRFSPSRISLYLFCPRAYFFYYHRGLRWGGMTAGHAF